MNKFENQLEVEQSLSSKEVIRGVHTMVTSTARFRTMAQEAVAHIHHVLSEGNANPFIAGEVTEDMVMRIMSQVIGIGYGNMIPLQSLAALVRGEVGYVGTDTDRYHLALEVCAAVAQTLESIMELRKINDSYFVISEYDNQDINMAAYKAMHPAPFIVKPRVITDIHSNAYRSDTQYRVLLGSRHNHHDEPIPVDILNYLSREVAYSIEGALHTERPWYTPRPAKCDEDVYKRKLHLAKLHSKGTRIITSYLVDSGNKFYFAHSFDKRLRTYSKGFQLNLQGTEYDKSLIEFHRKELLTPEGLEWLYIATANAYGLDKEPFPTRVQWVKDNLNDLESFTPKADERLIFAKCVRAIRTHELGEPVGIPIHIDATASGLQINGCLLGCRDTMVMTNVIGNDEGKRMDVYTEIHSYMKSKKAFFSTLTRKQVKKAAVPAIYGSQAEPERVFEDEVDTFWKAFAQMKGAFYYLQHLPALWRDDMTEYTFTLPDGYKVYVPVLGKFEVPVKVDCLGDTVVISHEVMGRKEISKCFLANITHALDAYILRNIVRRCKEMSIDIMCIHDSFGIHPNYAGLIAQWYREELAALTILNPLPRILKEIFGHPVRLHHFGHNRNKLAQEILDTSVYALS